MDEPNGDNSCDVCGEDVEGKVYVALMHFGVYDEKRRGINYSPEFDVADEEFTDWLDVAPIRLVHMDCIPMFFDGVHAGVKQRIQQEEDG